MGNNNILDSSESTRRSYNIEIIFSPKKSSFSDFFEASGHVKSFFELKSCERNDRDTGQTTYLTSKRYFLGKDLCMKGK